MNFTQLLAIAVTPARFAFLVIHLSSFPVLSKELYPVFVTVHALLLLSALLGQEPDSSPVTSAGRIGKASGKEQGVIMISYRSATKNMYFLIHIFSVSTLPFLGSF